MLKLCLLCLFFFQSVYAQVWQDSDTLSSMWSACSRHDTQTLQQILQHEPDAAFARSSDGRGPLFWAYEYAHTEAIDILEKLGVDPLAEDADGNTPRQLGIDNAEINAHRQFPQATTYQPTYDYDDYDDYEDEL